MVQKWPFFQLFFLFNISQENVFYDILERKNAFLGQKTTTSNSRRNDFFLKGLTHCFGPKLAVFPTSFLGNISKENVFYDILEQKNIILGYKKKRFKKSKNWHFSKQINPWFWSKNDHFSTFFFRQYSIGKCSLRYSTTRKRLSRLKKKEVQKIQKLTFFQRG